MPGATGCYLLLPAGVELHLQVPFRWMLGRAMRGDEIMFLCQFRESMME